MNGAKVGAVMVTILKNSEFEQLTTTQKGNVGERIIQDFLEQKDFVCYRPITEKGHPFDFLAIKDKTLAIAAEVKTKALMSKMPATGFDEKHFKYYMEFAIKHQILIFIFFVDESLKQIYGNWLHELEKPCTVGDKQYPFVMKCKNGKTIRLYPYSKMKIIANLNDETVEQLKQLSTRNYEYPI